MFNKSLKYGLSVFGTTYTKEFDSPHLHHARPLNRKALNGLSFSFGQIMVKSDKIDMSLRQDIYKIHTKEKAPDIVESLILFPEYSSNEQKSIMAFIKPLASEDTRGREKVIRPKSYLQ